MAHGAYVNAAAYEQAMTDYERRYQNVTEEQLEEDVETFENRITLATEAFLLDPDLPIYNRIQIRSMHVMMQLKIHGPESHLYKAVQTFHQNHEDMTVLMNKHRGDQNWSACLLLLGTLSRDMGTYLTQQQARLRHEEAEAEDRAYWENLDVWKKIVSLQSGPQVSQHLQAGPRPRRWSDTALKGIESMQIKYRDST